MIFNCFLYFRQWCVESESGRQCAIIYKDKDQRSPKGDEKQVIEVFSGLYC